MNMHRLLTVLLGTPEEINGGERCPTYMYRWTLFQPKWGWLKGFGVYVHRFVADDWSRDMHDHPKRFISIGLKGGYIEWTPERVTQATIWTGPDGEEVARSDEYELPWDARCGRTFRAPWFRTFPAEPIHRISLLPDRRPCWTLVIVLRASRRWGFWHGGRFIPWREYVNGEIADRMKACP